MYLVRSFFLLLLLSGMLLSGCRIRQKAETVSTSKASTQAAKITFIELGSNNCIPCRKMQPVMQAIEQKYAGKVQG